jgi:hypothetical protein
MPHFLLVLNNSTVCESVGICQSAHMYCKPKLDFLVGKLLLFCHRGGMFQCTGGAEQIQIR